MTTEQEIVAKSQSREWLSPHELHARIERIAADVEELKEEALNAGPLVACTVWLSAVASLLETLLERVRRAAAVTEGERKADELLGRVERAVKNCFGGFIRTTGDASDRLVLELSKQRLVLVDKARYDELVAKANGV